MPNASEPPPLPTNLAAAHAMILADRAARLVSEIAVERLKLEVARLRRERFGASSERTFFEINHQNSGFYYALEPCLKGFQ